MTRVYQRKLYLVARIRTNVVELGDFAKKSIFVVILFLKCYTLIVNIVISDNLLCRALYIFVLIAFWKHFNQKSAE